MEKQKRTQYKLSDIHPFTMDERELAQMTEYKLHRLPWEVIAVERDEVTAITADRLYMADLYLRDGEVCIEAHRYYADRKSRVVWDSPARKLGILPKGSHEARLKTLAAQLDKHRIGELIHLHHGIHTLFCDKPCPYWTLPVDQEEADRIANARWSTDVDL